MNKQYYDLLGITEDATDEEIAARYEELKKKYSEERFLEGEAGNEAAKLLSRVEVAYAEIMSERKEKRSAENADSSYAKVEQFIRDGKINEAQGALDEFNERPAEWHYLQSVVFYKKNWMNESKKQLEIAIQMDGSNEKYRTALSRLDTVMGNGKADPKNVHSQSGDDIDMARQQTQNGSDDIYRGNALSNCCTTYCLASMCCDTLSCCCR